LRVFAYRKRCISTSLCCGLMKKNNTLLIVDDHILFRAGIKKLIESYELFSEIVEAGNGNEALSILTIKKIDLMLLDLSMPEMDGMALIAELTTRKMKINTIVLTMYNEPILIHNLLSQGIDGFFEKNTEIDPLIEAMSRIMAGDIFFPSKYDRALKESIHNGGEPINLRNKEMEIIRCLSKGMTSKEIANFTGYTERTIETKKVRLGKKLNAKNSAEIVDRAYKLGMLRINE
jgi:DNA-binding NarL/FixJ family response regulator